jgi:hypothetical protein
MILLNFSHPITPEQQAQIEALTGQAVAEIRSLDAQFDQARPFAEQMNGRPSPSWSTRLPTTSPR